MAFIIINLFVDMFAISFVLLFVSVVLQGIFSGAFSNNDFTLEKSANKTWLDCMVLISKILSAFGMGIGAGSLFIAGGGPKIVGEEYCIVNHGTVVRVISGNWYIFLCLPVPYAFLWNVDIYNIYVCKNKIYFFNAIIK